MNRLQIVFLAATAWLAAWSAALAVPPLEAYGRLPGIDAVELSPSGARFATVGEVEGQRRLVVIEGGKLLVSVGSGDVRVRSLDWAGENLVLVTTSKAYDLGAQYGGKYEIEQVFVLDVAKKTLLPIFRRGRLANGVWGFYGVAQKEGRWVGYFAGLTVEKSASSSYLVSGHPDLYEVDLDDGNTRPAAPKADDRHYRQWLVAPGGGVMATADFAEGSGDWRLYAGKSKGDELAYVRTPMGDAHMVGHGRTPGTILYSLPTDDGDSTWHEVSAKGGEPVKVNDQADNARPIFDRRTELMIGYRTFGSRPSVKMFDKTLDARVRGAFKAFPGLSVSLISWNEDFKRMVVFTEGEGDSGTYWLVDIPTGSAAVVGSPYPLVRSGDVGPSRMVSYKAADGLEMEGVLTLPPGREAKGLPVVVMPHGGPASHDQVGFDWWAQAFASRGYAVFQPNFRGSTGYGADFHGAGQGQWGRKMQTDISDGLADLARQGIVDPKRACIVGASYGGYAALAGVTLQNGLYRCAVSYAGVADMAALRTFQSERSDGTANPTTRYWNSYIGPRSVLDDISPSDQAKRADAPVLLVHGKDDTIVPIDQSRAMQSALRRAKKPVEFITLDGEDHWLSGEATRLALLKASVDFVEKHNPAN